MKAIKRPLTSVFLCLSVFHQFTGDLYVHAFIPSGLMVVSLTLKERGTLFQLIHNSTADGAPACSTPSSVTVGEGRCMAFGGTTNSEQQRATVSKMCCLTKVVPPYVKEAAAVS